ncbi:DUF6055 domain-containing protein [Pinibacter aurantiacus]|uniref:DUF4859 domain-containing protein n=1 Tax=Pinibacter aurantiacus TaxID=2851599 RepID=A0A9E2SB82_9BACT|nr:DUF6055 domain-containing protein [Pinibacter aurantiacus]MBV4358209.1 hypothetical protein [Pinibacter aurantiacus]
MRILSLAVCYTVLVILLSCSKGSKGSAPGEETTYTASYASNVFKVAKGAKFTSASIVHDFPANVQFSILDVRNTSGKTVSAFLDKYSIGTWSQPVNKNTDLTEAAVIAKYTQTEKSGVSIDAATGVITIEGATTQNISSGTYYILVQAKVNDKTYTLSNIASIELTESVFAPVKANWKYSTEANAVQASVNVTKLSGSYLNDVAATIPNYKASKTYLRLKISDNRDKGIIIPENIDWTSNFSLTAINPWTTTVKSSDAIILSSPINRFPVLEQDSVLKGTIKAASLLNKTAINFDVTLNVTGEGIYDAVIKLNNNPAQNVLWWPGGKSIYMPNQLKSNNFNDNNSQWSYERMDWSDNAVVFWEKGFGSDPSSSATKKVDIKTMLSNIEHDYKFYYDTMHFVKAGQTKADQYRTIIMLYEQADWLATGSGYDSQTGAIWINYSAANDNATLAHEIGHTFQYLNSCDGNYAFTGSQNYIGQIWEQTAQYQATLLYPTAYFSYIPSFLPKTHLNLLHEDNRYSNFYHLQYWHLLHGIDFVGKLWQQAITGEDAVEAYQRITGINQSQFNDEIYDYARRTLNWNFLHKSYYTNYVLSSSASYTQNAKVNAMGDGYYIIDTSRCVQNYGFNALQLTVPAAGTVVQVAFEGVKGNSLYNTTYDQYAGWRWGFVAVTSTGSVEYGAMNSSNSGSASFTVPNNTSRLYLVVSGAPTQHFHHAWDNNLANDEQYPWKAKFENTLPKN